MRIFSKLVFSKVVDFVENSNFTEHTPQKHILKFPIRQVVTFRGCMFDEIALIQRDQQFNYEKFCEIPRCLKNISSEKFSFTHLSRNVKKKWGTFTGQNNRTLVFNTLDEYLYKIEHKIGKKYVFCSLFILYMCIFLYYSLSRLCMLYLYMLHSNMLMRVRVQKIAQKETQNNT